MPRVFQLLVVFLLAGSAAFGQSNLVQRMTNVHLQVLGVTLGYLETNLYGTLRFSTNSGLQIYLPPGVWQGLSTGSVTECDAPANPGGTGNVSLSNAWRVIYSGGDTGVVELPLGPEGTVLWSSGETSAPAFALPAVPLTNFLPLTAYERYRQVYYAATRSTFYAKIPISSSIPYTSHPSYTNTYPIPGYDGEIVWGYVARGGVDGDDGAPGAPADDGTDGLDGFGYMRYGPWQVDKGYAYDTNALVVVSYGGRWYDCIRSSTGVYPSAVGASNYWSASIYSGMDGTLYSTNLIDRGPWSSSETGYTSNDVVVYAGNLFYVFTNRPGTGTPPSVDADGVGMDNAYWDVRERRGPRGYQGVAGRDGEVTHLTNIVQWTILDAGASVVVTNSQDSTNRVFYFDYWVGGIVGGTGVYHWGAALAGTGTLTNETDPAFMDWLGTNAYLKGEVDPKFSSWLGTNAYVKTESDPVWLGASTGYARLAGSTFDELSVTTRAVIGHQVVNYETLQEALESGSTASVTDAVQRVVTLTGASTPDTLVFDGLTSTVFGATTTVHVVGPLAAQFLPLSGGGLTGPLGINCGTNSFYIRGSPVGGRVWFDVRGGGFETATDFVISNVAKLVIADIDRCLGGGVQLGALSYVRGSHGVSVGYSADSDVDGASIGYSAASDDYGVCVLKTAANTAMDRKYAVAIGYDTRVYRDAIGIGRGASPSETNIALGCMAFARDGGPNCIALGNYTALPGATNAVAIGAFVTNRISNSTVLRGSLYLDGGTGIFARSSFGSGAWRGPIEFGGSIVLANVQTTHPAAVAGKAQIYSFYDGTNTVIYTMRSDGTYTLQTSHRNGRPAFVHGNVYDGWEETIYLDGLKDGMKKIKGAKNKNDEDAIVASLSSSNALPDHLRRDWKAEQKASVDARQKEIDDQAKRKSAADAAMSAWAAMKPEDKKKYIAKGGKIPVAFSETVLTPYQEIKR